MQRSKVNMVYYPYLDGLRFLAFLAVFIHHAPIFWPAPFLITLKSYGWLGLDLFLCLSAFLFTKLLLVEFQTKGDLNIKNFYIRRALRIWPLYFTFFGVMLLLTINASGWNPIIFLRTLGMVTFTDNIFAAFLSYNLILASAHLWTVSYEEQFYAIIPWLLRWMFKATQKTRIFFIVGMLLVGSLIRALMIYCGVSHPAIWVLPITHFESIVGGLIAGLGLFDRHLEKIPSWLLATAGGIALVAVTALPNVDVIGWQLMLSYPLVGAGMFLILASLTKEKLWFMKRLLQNKTLAYLGKISYGLYVYHLLGIMFGAQLAAIFNVSTQRLVMYPFFIFSTGLVITILVSMLSYQLLEKPFLHLKERFTTIQSRPI